MLQAKPLPGDALARVHAIREVLIGNLSIKRKNQILREIIDPIELWPDADFSQPPTLRVHLPVGSLVAASVVQSRR